MFALLFLALLLVALQSNDLISYFLTNREVISVPFLSGRPRLCPVPWRLSPPPWPSPTRGEGIIKSPPPLWGRVGWGGSKCTLTMTAHLGADRESLAILRLRRHAARRRARAGLPAGPRAGRTALRAAQRHRGAARLRHPDAGLRLASSAGSRPRRRCSFSATSSAPESSKSAKA